MEDLKKARGPVRGIVTKIIQALTDELGKPNPDEVLVETKLNRLEANCEKLRECDGRIETQLLDDNSTETDIAKEAADVEDYEEKIAAIRIRAEKFLHSPVRPVSRSASSASGTSFGTAWERQKRNYSLPKIQLRTFNGDLKEWLGFWAQFSKIHEDDELHASDRFQYLAQSIVKDSPADKVLECYPQSEANYPKVVAALQERFGNKDVLLDVYIRELIKMSTGLNDKAPLSAVYYKLESHLKSLESLGAWCDK